MHISLPWPFRPVMVVTIRGSYDHEMESYTRIVAFYLRHACSAIAKQTLGLGRSPDTGSDPWMLFCDLSSLTSACSSLLPANSDGPGVSRLLHLLRRLFDIVR